MSDTSNKSSRDFIALNIVVLCISDSRTIENDTSGKFLKTAVTNSGHKLSGHYLVRDDFDQIREVLSSLSNNPDIDVVLSTGGTGLTGRDITVEAHRSIYEKEIDAFGPTFAQVSFKKIGASAIQSRACGGIVKGKFLFALPGSPSACRDAWDEILRSQLDYRNKPCNLVEILPRLEEHKRRK